MLKKVVRIIMIIIKKKESTFTIIPHMLHMYKGTLYILGQYWKKKYIKEFNPDNNKNPSTKGKKYLIVNIYMKI